MSPLLSFRHAEHRGYRSIGIRRLRWAMFVVGEADATTTTTTTASHGADLRVGASRCVLAQRTGTSCVN